MRLSYRGGPLTDNEGKFIAWNLGADYCAEHEWGIVKLKKLLGIGSKEKIFSIYERKVFGIERRRITKADPDTIYYNEVKNRAVLIVGDEVKFERSYNGEEGLKKIADRFKPYRSYSDYKSRKYTTKPTTAWDQGAFIIHVEGKEHKEYLRELYEAIKSGDAALWLGGGGVFENAGLVVGIISRIPKDAATLMYDRDKEQYELERDAKKTGIENRLRKAGKGWHALSPGRLLKSTKRGEVKSKYNVMFWLNPMDQQQNNYGWFTVEQLDQWAKDEGPIIKKDSVDKK